MSTSGKTISFFGPTGGCCFGTLWRSLEAGHQCRVLSRTPDKLISMLKARNIESHKLSSPFLEIITGDVRNEDDVKRALVFETGNVTDVIVCGIGGRVPILQFNLRYPLGMEDPRTCYKATKNIISALTTLRSERSTSLSGSPLFVVVSSAGVATEYRDWPILMWLFYGWMLNMQLEDKRLAHKELLKAAAVSDLSQAPLFCFVSVRPSHLEDGEPRGLGQVRDGVVGEGVMGYWIRRDDVAAWMYEKCIVPAEVQEKYLNNNVNVTY